METLRRIRILNTMTWSGYHYMLKGKQFLLLELVKLGIISNISTVKSKSKPTATEIVQELSELFKNMKVPYPSSEFGG